MGEWYSQADPGSFMRPTTAAVGPGLPDPGSPQGYSSSSRPPGDSGSSWSWLPEWWHPEFYLIVYERRVEAVFRAITTAPVYIPQAIYEATGEELHEIVAGVVYGVLLCLGVVSATTVLGAAVGAAVGALVSFGGLAVPGAVAGADVGFSAGMYVLNYLGLAFLVVYVGGTLWEASKVAAEAVSIAWDSVDDRGTQWGDGQRPAQRLAFAVGLVFRGVLQGIVAFLLTKGVKAAGSRVPELVSQLRNSRLGVAFAEWIQNNWTRLINNPRLRKQGAAGSGGVGAGTGKTQEPEPTQGPGQKEPLKPPARNPAKLAEGFADLARPHEVRTAERLAAEYPEFDGRTFKAEPPPDPGHDWTDDLGRTYDAVGDGTKESFLGDDAKPLINSIQRHVWKSNDFTVVDLTGYRPAQIANVRSYLDGLPAAAQAKIRRVGF